MPSQAKLASLLIRCMFSESIVGIRIRTSEENFALPSTLFFDLMPNPIFLSSAFSEFESNCVAQNKSI